MAPTTRLPTPIDAARARAYPAVPHTYTEADAILYALAVGAPASDLARVYEGSADFAPLPTFPLVLPYHGVNAAVPFEELVPNFSPVRWGREREKKGRRRRRLFFRDQIEVDFDQSRKTNPTPPPFPFPSLSRWASCTANSTWSCPATSCRAG